MATYPSPVRTGSPVCIPNAYPHDAGSQSSLALLGGRGGVRGLREYIEERVPLGVDLDPTVSLKGLAQQPAVLLQRRVVFLAEVLQEARRALDVSEEEGHCPGRKAATCHIRELATRARFSPTP